MEEITKRKLLRSACHASALASWSVLVIGVPIAILMFNDDPLVKDSAKEALNFSISIIIWALLSLGICFTVIGIPLGVLMLIILGLASTILPIIAIVSVCADPKKTYRYPFTFRLINPGDPKEIEARA